MKPFNIEEARAGKPVCIADVTLVRILCTDRPGMYPVVTLEGKYISSYTERGNYINQSEVAKILYMAPTTQEGWINIYETLPGDTEAGRDIYQTEQEAIRRGKHSSTYITTIKIAWEE